MTDCRGVTQTASVVQTAANAVPADQRFSLLGFETVGDIVQSSSLSPNTSTSEPDRKLWIIGAVLGPVFFVLLLIGLFAFLHYKFRPRRNIPSSATVY